MEILKFQDIANSAHILRNLMIYGSLDSSIRKNIQAAYSKALNAHNFYCYPKISAFSLPVQNLGF